MAISFNPKEYNLFNSMYQVVSFYLEDPEQVLRRRFRRLHFYSLYQKHKYLVELDEKVGTLERECGPTNLDTNHPFSTKVLDTLLSDIDKGLQDFDAASMLYQRSVEAPSVPQYLLDQYRTVTMKKAVDVNELYEIEEGWKECALHTATEKGPVHRLLDRCIRSSGFLQRLFTQDTEQQNTVMQHYPERSARLAEGILINLAFCALLLVPIVLLMYLPNRGWKLIVVTVFVLLSTFLSSFMATATQKPGLAIVAGYAAILVVFLSNSHT